MKFDVSEEKENKLLHRKEIRGILTYEKETPSREQLQAYLAGTYGADKELVILDKIDNIFGARQAKIYVKVYDLLENMQLYERQKPTEEKEEPAGEKKESPEEKPAEEKKEKPEVKEEKKEKPEVKEEKKEKPEVKEEKPAEEKKKSPEAKPSEEKKEEPKKEKPPEEKKEKPVEKKESEN